MWCGKTEEVELPAEILIMTGEPTMLEYLMEPLIDSLRRSFAQPYLCWVASSL